MKVALFQYDVLTDPKQNLLKIQEYAASLKGKGVDLLVLPELCLSAYIPDLSTITFHENDEIFRSLMECAKEFGGYILGSFIIQDGHTRHNRALYIGADGIVARRDKQRLFTYWEEHNHVLPGLYTDSVEVHSWKISPFICYELRFPELFRAVKGNHLMIVIAQWPSSRKDHWLTLLKARAIENQCYVIGVNRVGVFKEREYAGNSVLYGPKGETILQLDGHLEELQMATIEMEPLEKYREEFPALRDAELVIVESFKEGG